MFNALENYTRGGEYRSAELAPKPRIKKYTMIAPLGAKRGMFRFGLCLNFFNFP
jgi:hypothetical protein